MMKRKVLAKIIIKIIARYTDVDEKDINVNSIISDELGLFSLDFVTVIADIENILHIRIEDWDATVNIKTIQELIDVVELNLSRKYKIQASSMFVESRQNCPQNRFGKKGLNWIIELFIAGIMLFLSAMLIRFITFCILALKLYFDRGVSYNGFIKSYTEQLSINPSEWNNYTTVIGLYSMVIGIIIICMYVKYIQHRSTSSIGLKKVKLGKEIIWGMISGFGSITVVVLLSAFAGGINITFSENVNCFSILLYFGGWCIQGLFEEVFCRGYFATSIYRRYSLPTTIFLSSLAFAFCHLMNTGITILGTVNIFLYGVLCILYMIKRDSIWGVATFHATWNFVQGNIYGLSVSGNSENWSVLNFVNTETANQLINGGTFGIEGSIFMTIIMIFGIAVIYYLVPNVSEDSIVKGE